MFITAQYFILNRLNEQQKNNWTTFFRKRNAKQQKILEAY